MIYLLATNNPSKASEIRPMFAAAKLELITLADLGLYFEAKEDGQTFAHNAMQKAAETAAFLKRQALLATGDYSKFLSPFNVTVLADDSGLVIDALDGEPGVDSALYLGRDTSYHDKCQSLLDRLAGTPDDRRTARFICVIACIMPDGSQHMAEGISEGLIAHEASGEYGFGYDPIFYYLPYGKTLAQLSQDEKNKISHRGQAVLKMIGLIKDANFSN